MVVEYDHKYNVKWKSFQKVVQIKPEVGIVVAEYGSLASNLQRAAKHSVSLKSPLYICSLKERKYELVLPAGSG